MSSKSILALSLALTAACAESQPAGDYLFDLTEAEIVDVAEAYGQDSAELLTVLAAPFDCAHVGDLCDAVGEQRAVQIVEDAWTRLEAGDALDLAQDEVGAQIGEGMIAHAAEQAQLARTSYNNGQLSVDASCYWNGPILWTVYGVGGAEHSVASGGGWSRSQTNLRLDMTLRFTNNGQTTTKTKSQSKFDSYFTNSLSFGSSADSASLDVAATVISNGLRDNDRCTWVR